MEKLSIGHFDHFANCGVNASRISLSLNFKDSVLFLNLNTWYSTLYSTYTWHNILVYVILYVYKVFI